QRGRAHCQMEKISVGKFHDGPHKMLSRRLLGPHCGFMLASRRTFPHFVVSVLNCAAHSSCVLPTGSLPGVAIRSFMPGSAIVLTVSRWSSAMISLDTRAGTMTANHASPSMPG